MRTLLTGLFVAVLATSALAEENLEIGDAVPKIDIAHFFQGDEVTGFHKEKTYVLEFWATW